MPHSESCSCTTRATAPAAAMPQSRWPRSRWSWAGYRRWRPLTKICIDAPSGLLKAYARVRGGKVISSGFENVESFAPLLGCTVTVAGLGDVVFDLAFGGAFYAYVDAETIGLKLDPDNAREIV